MRAPVNYNEIVAFFCYNNCVVVEISNNIKVCMKSIGIIKVDLVLDRRKIMAKPIDISLAKQVIEICDNIENIIIGSHALYNLYCCSTLFASSKTF